MIWFAILLGHLLGDYVLQNSYMAAQKTKSGLVAAYHGIIQGWLFAMAVSIFAPSPAAVPIVISLVVVAVTHAVIDRYRLAKQAVWAVNQIAPPEFRYRWSEGRENNGHPEATPAWMSTWLMIIADNTLHLAISFALAVWILA